jgi:hypothetical protein
MDLCSEKDDIVDLSLKRRESINTWFLFLKWITFGLTLLRLSIDGTINELLSILYCLVLLEFSYVVSRIMLYCVDGWDLRYKFVAIILLVVITLSNIVSLHIVHVHIVDSETTNIAFIWFHTIHFCFIGVTFLIPCIQMNVYKNIIPKNFIHYLAVYDLQQIATAILVALFVSFVQCMIIVLYGVSSLNYLLIFLYLLYSCYLYAVNEKH